MRDLGDAQAVTDWLAAYPDSSGFLYDTYGKSQSGGSGTAFDWSKLPAHCAPRLLAGGLNPDNVAVAIRACHPFAVDVSSGVESAPGIKSSAKMQRFITAVHNAYDD